MAVSFELSRMTKTYDYRRFLTGVLGKGWMIYEVTYIAFIVLVLSVLGSAAGLLAKDAFGFSETTGVVLMMIAVGALVFYGSALIEKVLAFWSLGLYAIYIIFLIASFSIFGDQIASNVGASKPDASWFVDGVRYAAYNIGIVPAVLFCLRHVETRREALSAGLLAGPIAMIPALLFYFAMLGHYPAVLNEAVPVNFLLGKMNLPILQLGFQIILLGTFVETGTGFIHGLNERIAGAYEEHKKIMPGFLRAAIAIVALVVSIYIASAIGLVNLIGKGYGTITWAFLLVFVLPVLTIGVWKIARRKDG